MDSLIKKPPLTTAVFYGECAEKYGYKSAGWGLPPYTRYNPSARV